jgi:hypothetical protein
MVVGPDSSEREGKAGLAGGPPRGQRVRVAAQWARDFII